MPKCGAKNRKGQPCQNGCAAGRNRCKFHGGATPVGPDHHNWKHGRYSKFLPARLLERYHEGANDPNLTALQDELALVDVRIGELLRAVGTTGNLRLWKDARAKLYAFKGGGDGKRARELASAALRDLDGILTAGLTDAATWESLAELIDLRRRLAESETRRQKDLHQMISARAALQMLAQLVTAVRDRVKDPDVIEAVNQEYLRLTS